MLSDAILMAALEDVMKSCGRIGDRQDSIDLQLKQHNARCEEENNKRTCKILWCPPSFEMPISDWNAWIRFISLSEVYLEWQTVVHTLERLRITPYGSEQRATAAQMTGLLTLLRQEATLELQVLDMFEKWRSARTTVSITAVSE